MDFLDPSKKRAHIIRLYIGYVLVGIALVLATLILLFYSYGYRLDRQNGGVIQNGLLFVSARPETADIYVNGQVRRERTDTRLSLPAGDYSLELKRAGYQSWQRHVQLDGGQVLRLDYPLLLPTTLAPKMLQHYAAPPSLVSQSPDRQWLVVGQPNTIQSLEIFDTNNLLNAPAVLQLSDTLFTASSTPQSLKPLEWAHDNRHLLIEHIFGDKHEFILLDREQPSAAVNLNRLFNLQPSRVTLRSGRADQVYLYDNARQLLFRGSLPSGGVLETVQGGVLAFEPTDNDQVLYVSQPTATLPTSLKLLASGKDLTLRSLPVNSTYLLAAAQYDGHSYLAVGSSVDGRVYLYRDAPEVLQRAPLQPLTGLILTKVVGLQSVVFSPIGRFLLAQGAAKIAVYDNYTSDRFNYDSPADGSQALRWLDDFHLTTVKEGQGTLLDFDGSNRRSLVTTGPLGAYLSRDSSQLITVSPSLTSGVEINRMSLRANSN